MTRIAPSAVNYQPWRILRDVNGYHFYLARKPGYNEKRGIEIQKIDIGIAFSHFVLAAKEKGLKGGIGYYKPAVDTDFEYIRSWMF
jgi:nitroreductase